MASCPSWFAAFDAPCCPDGIFDSMPIQFLGYQHRNPYLFFFEQFFPSHRVCFYSDAAVPTNHAHSHSPSGFRAKPSNKSLKTTRIGAVSFAGRFHRFHIVSSGRLSSGRSASFFHHDTYRCFALFQEHTHPVADLMSLFEVLVV